MEIQPSANFKKMAVKAILSIISFIFVYIILLIFAIALTIACAAGGILLIVAAPQIMTIILGVGLAALGFFVLVFLFKFLFKKHEVDRSHLEEISENEYPLLFSFIEETATEAGVSFPKKVYLSSDVNAAVFYNSSFWSMFFPVRKNLQIGVGLINTVTEQELKAILAHEFGHFSQRSMSVGSYVYNVNQVIYNMLYDNDSFDEMIRKWANISGYFSIFVWIAVKIIHLIQWILKKMYDLINLNYMALSREMEFHADEVAANIAGSLALETSLLRLNLAQYSYNQVLGLYEQKRSDNIKSSNIYKEQSFVMEFNAKENGMSLNNNLPEVSLSEQNKYNRSKLNIKDQWASHPDTVDRVEALRRLGIKKTGTNENLAICLFSDFEKVSSTFTEKLFPNLLFTGQTTVWQTEDFIKEYTEWYHHNSFPKVYKDYYDNKNPISFDIESISDFEQSETIETLFGRQKIDMVYTYIALENDKRTLESIRNKEIQVKTFDYDGQKYRSKDAGTIIEAIDIQMADLLSEIKENDIAVYKFFYQQGIKVQKARELKNKYIALFDAEKEFDKRFELYVNFIRATDFLRTNIQAQYIENYFKELYKVEDDLKIAIRSLLQETLLDKDITKAIRDIFDKYLSKEWRYTANQEADEEYLETLFASVNHFYDLFYRSFFLTKKDLLDFQAGLLEE